MTKRHSALMVAVLLLPSFFSVTNVQSHNAEHNLEIGWVYFNNGRYKAAAEVAEAFFEQSGQTERNKARARFLQGYAANKLREYKRARDYLFEAKEGFSKLDKRDPAHGYDILSSVAIAKTYMDQDKLDNAEEVLKKTLNPSCAGKKHEQTHSTQLGYKRFVEARLAYLKGDYQKAITLAKESLDACRKGNDSNGELNALSELGIAQLVWAHQTGKPLDDGLDNSQKAVKMAMEQKELNKIYFTMINLVFYEEVTGIKSNKKTLISQYIADTGDKELEHLLDQVIELARQKKKPSG